MRYALLASPLQVCLSCRESGSVLAAVQGQCSWRSPIHQMWLSALPRKRLRAHKAWLSMPLAQHLSPLRAATGSTSGHPRSTMPSSSRVSASCCGAWQLYGSLWPRPLVRAAAFSLGAGPQQLKLGHLRVILAHAGEGAIDASPPAPSSPASCYAFFCVRAGIGLGCISSGATQITADMMLAAARALGSQVTDSERERGAVLPNIARLRCDSAAP